MADDDFCYLTTTGRRSGRPHEIEIWFAADDERPCTLYLLAGAGRSSDWVRNLEADAACTVRVGRREAEPQPAHGRVIGPGDAEDAAARRLVFAKYQPRTGGDLTSWRETALPVAIDLGP
ncbi:MAG: nitroreductase/quinone reductase family protein [Acidimicrobiales bacterium]